ncbi:hypothetical protein [Litoribrevibacter albus]|uniref:Uncharacterized protein n=1 Tax=Litoribrevibacter albus TaxID=1473156 RepID=A0AA37S856_9GAMM|nr:hypothetical protein [Litoribrevibacter albus]GLQ29733.1 hypothetical protein GCM10007876_02110 [Litoribrevibacter albus]
MSSVETVIVFNIVGFTVMLLIMFALGWWFLKKQAKTVSDIALKNVQKEIHKAKQQLVKMNRQMMKDFNVDESAMLEFTPVVIDSKSIRAMEEIYKAFVVWGKTSADAASKISKLGAQELAGMHASKQEECLKTFYSEARKAYNLAQQLDHQIEFDAAYLDDTLIKDMSSMAKQTISLSESLLDHVKKSAEKSKSTNARDNLKLYAAMEKQAVTIVSFHNLEYKNFVKNNMAQKVRDLRAGMSQAGGEEAFEE